MNVETPPFKTAGPMSRRVEIERESRSPVKLNKKYKIQIFVYIWLFECLYYFTWEDRHCHTSDIEECRCDVCWVVDAEADGDDDDDAGHHVDGQAPEVHEAANVGQGHQHVEDHNGGGQEVGNEHQGGQEYAEQSQEDVTNLESQNWKNSLKADEVTLTSSDVIMSMVT